MAENPVSNPSSADPPPSQAQPPEPDSPSDPDSTRDARTLRQAGAVLLACGLIYAGIFFSRNLTASGNFDQGLVLQKERKCGQAMLPTRRAACCRPRPTAARSGRRSAALRARS
jgi:hypothetical protein